MQLDKQKQLISISRMQCSTVARKATAAIFLYLRRGM